MRLRRIVVLVGVLCVSLTTSAAFGQTDTSQQISVRLQAARAAIGEGKPEVARQEYEAILSLDPAQPDAHASLGLMAFFGADFPAAAGHFAEVVRAQPTSWDAQAFLGMALRRTGKRAEAIEALTAAFANLPAEADLKIQTGLELADVHFRSGELGQAAAAIDQLVESRPDSLEALYASHHIHSQLADRALQSMVAVSPESARLYQVIAQRKAKAGDLKTAIDYFARALELNPQLPGARFEYAQTLLLDTASPDSLELARDQFQAIAQANPNDPNAERALAEALSLLGDDVAATEHFERALQLNPNDAEAHFGLGKILATSEDPAAAIPHLEATIRLEPEHVLAHYRLSNAYQRLGRTEEADREAALFEELRAAQRGRDQLRELLGFSPDAP